mgnify:CR=1 FL=1
MGLFGDSTIERKGRLGTGKKDVQIILCAVQY